jgi:CubicO group peptidase (beta-lactamase class C family)
LLSDTLRAGAAPGAAIAMSIAGERMEASLGVANSASGEPLSSRSRFQLGCITKLLTSLVALELSNSGRLDLERPITAYLPEMDDVLAGRSLTSRHLLSHTSGYQGVNIADPGVRYYFGWPKFLEILRSGKHASSRDGAVDRPGAVGAPRVALRPLASWRNSR